MIRGDERTKALGVNAAVGVGDQLQRNGINPRVTCPGIVRESGQLAVVAAEREGFRQVADDPPAGRAVDDGEDLRARDDEQLEGGPHRLRRRQEMCRRMSDLGGRALAGRAVRTYVHGYEENAQQIVSNDQWAQIFLTN